MVTPTAALWRTRKDECSVNWSNVVPAAPIVGLCLWMLLFPHGVIRLTRRMNAYVGLSPRAAAIYTPRLTRVTALFVLVWLLVLWLASWR
jgi:hypothetical protein